MCVQAEAEVARVRHYSTAARIPPGLIRNSRSVGQYGCVSAGLCQMGCKSDPNGANMDRKWSSNEAQMGRGGTNGAQMGPSEVFVKLTWAQWGRNLGQMGPNEAQVWPRWGPMRPNRSPNGAKWDPSGGQNGSQMHSKIDRSIHSIADCLQEPFRGHFGAPKSFQIGIDS